MVTDKIPDRNSPDEMALAKRIDDSVFFDIDSVRYVAWPSTHSMKSFLDFDGRSLVTVIPMGEHNKIERPWLEQYIASCLADDDVFKLDFLSVLVFVGQQDPGGEASAEVRSLFESWGTKHCVIIAEHKDLLPGPHLAVDGKLYQVLRLYDDVQAAFLVSVRATTQSDRHELLNGGRHGWACCSAAVPSRQTFHQSVRKPFQGWRIVLKDAIDLEGINTSMCNRAYLGLYPPARFTAPAIAGIISGGASILGKTKLSSFLSREEPSESVDFQTPWNPRGDGYQTPGGSSSGSGVATAAYDWVDIGIGTDTNGSIRRPAQCNGVFGLRPSRGIFPHDGIYLAFRHFDVPGLLARDLSKMAKFVELWYKCGAKRPTAPSQKDLPVALVFPTNSESQEITSQSIIVNDMVRDFESFLGVTARRISVSSLWEENPPSEAEGQSLHVYMKDVGARTFLYSNYHAGDEFRDEYLKKFGKYPFVSPFVRWRWKLGKAITAEEHEDAMQRMHVYEQWFLKEVMQVEKFNSFLMSQSEDVKPMYRDDLPPDYYIQPAWHPWWFSSILGAPELVLPSGQISYESRISGRKEYLPVVTNLMSLPGTDLELMDTAQKFLEAVGRPTIVSSGKQMFAEKV